MSTADFSFQFDRVLTLGAAEAAPTTTDDPRVQQLPSAEAMKGKRCDALLLVCTAVAIDYEVGVWDATTGTRLVVATGSLTAATPAVIPWPYQGARVDIRRTNITVADSRMLAVQVQGSATMQAATLAAILAKLSSDPATQTTLAAILAKLSADPATQTTLAAILSALGSALPLPSRAAVDKALSSSSHTLHDSTACTAGAVAFVVDTSGTYTYRLKNDSGDRTCYFAAGSWNPGEPALIKATGSPASAKATLFFLV